MSARNSLLSIRQDILEKLRSIAPLDVAELERIDRALAAMDPREAAETSPGEFSGIQIVEAVRVYLTRVQHPVSLPQLTKVLVYGGAGAGKGVRAPEWKIAQSIGYHVSRGTLTVDADMVGLPEWGNTPPQHS